VQQEALGRRWWARLQAWQILLRDQLARIDVHASFWPDRLHFHHRGVGAGTRSAGDGGGARAGGRRRAPGKQAAVSPEERESTPVMFDNPPFVRPFEPLVASPGAAQVRGI